MGKPVIYRSNVSKRVIRAKGIIAKFAGEMEGSLKEMYARGGLLEGVPWDQPDRESGPPSPDFVLSLRKMLVSEIKSGMLERKNRELEIAVLAMVVWFTRLENDTIRQRLLGEW